MKKYIVFFCICFMLVGCTSNEQVKSDFKYILFATPLNEHTIWLKAKEGFDKVCAEEDLKCDWLGPTVIDTIEMENVIETGILQSADAIITQGVIDNKIIDKAYEEEIPVFLVDSDMPNSKRFAYMGKDFNKQAQLLLQDIEKRYGKQKHLKIAIQVAEKDFKIAQDQIVEVEKVFENHEGGFEIVSISESKSDNVRAKKEWSIVLEENNDINVAINFAAESAEFCSELAEDKGIKSKMLIYGVDDIDSTLKMVEKGKIDGTIVTSFYDYGYKSVKMLLEYLEKKGKPSQEIYSPTLILVSRENVKTYEK